MSALVQYVYTKIIAASQPNYKQEQARISKQIFYRKQQIADLSSLVNNTPGINRRSIVISSQFCPAGAVGRYHL
jgi:hypothetical protein